MGRPYRRKVDVIVIYESTPTSPCQRPSKGLQGHYSQNKSSTNSSLKWPQGKGPQ
jgi:hypothetical protein